MNHREKLLWSEIKKFLSILKNKYDPELILLFGSLSSGIVKEWSDIDLVIVKNTVKPFYQRLKEVYSLLKPKVGTDILVYTPGEYSEMKKRLFFSEEILKKGKMRGLSKTREKSNENYKKPEAILIGKL